MLYDMKIETNVNSIYPTMSKVKCQLQVPGPGFWGVREEMNPARNTKLIHISHALLSLYSAIKILLDNTLMYFIF